MKKHIIRSLILICVLTLVCTVLPMQARAETYGDWEYEVNSGLATITKYNGTDAVVTVPEKFDLYQVTTIGEKAFSGNATMEKVIFPAGLTTIERYAFLGCVGLEEVELPAKLTTLGARAFQNCTNITKIVVNSTSLSDMSNNYGENGQPFYGAGTASTGIAVEFGPGCMRVPARMFWAYNGSASAANIVSVSLADSVTEIAGNAFDGCIYLKEINLGSVVTVGGEAFQGCVSLTDISWSNKLTTIGESAFAKCTSLLKLAFPASLTTIGEYAFNGCSALKEILFPDGLITIGKFSFMDCVDLPEITLPVKLATLGARAFQGCTNVTKITVNSTTLNNMSNAYGENGQPFYKVGTTTSGTEVIFGDGCTRVPERMFCAYSGPESAANITSVTMADTVTEIAPQAFKDCIYLTDVDTGNGVATIGEYAFSGCTKLASVTLSDSLTSIANHAFYNCSKLENVVLPSSLSKLGEYAFEGCVSFTEITLPAKLTTLGARAFQNCTNVSKITVNSISLANMSNAYGVNGQPFYGVGTATAGTAVVFGDGCTRVPERLFYVHDSSSVPANIVSVEVADTVTEVAAMAFKGCVHLKTVDLGNGVASVGESVFNGCTELTSVALSDTLTGIGSFAFQNCAKLGNVTFPSGLSSIGKGAFSGCAAFTEVTLPAKLATLGTGAFENCTSVSKITVNSTSLKDITATYYGEHGQPFYCAGTRTNGVDVVISDGVTRIPANLFHAYDGIAYAPAIVSVTIGADVKEIADNAFTNCNLLTTITFEGMDPDTIKDNVFTGVVATAYHPGWPTEKQLDYGGDITWVGYAGCQHVWDAGTVTQEPTMSRPGIKTYTCTLCGDTKTEEVTFTCDHANTELKGAQSATCEKTGYTGDTVCITCGTLVSQGQVIPMEDHLWDSGVVTLEPTATDPGVRTYTCKICSETYEEEIPVVSCTHRYGTWKVVTPAACEQEGLRTRSCVLCGDVQEEIIPALEHDYNNKGICTECGQKDPNKPSDPVVPAGQVIRLAGDNRYETAFAIADELKNILGVDKFDTVILASSSNFADALAGSYLAAVKDAPILLAKEKYADIVCDYLNKNLADGGTIYMLGGADVMPWSILDDMNVDYRPKRLSGDDRYATNLAILKHAPIGSSDLLVATGRDFADSLSASATGLPILLVNSKAGRTLSAEQKDFLRSVTGDIYIIGGESAVSESFESQIRSVVGSNVAVSRISGASRYETSVAIARKFLPDAQTAVVAFAGDYPDGLCGGPLSYATGSPLILTKNGKTEAPDYTASKNITSGYVLGSDNLISDGSVKIIFGGTGPSSGNNGNTGSTYTVTFNTQGGSTVAAQKVEKGKAASEPAEPEKRGSLFMGWYTSAAPKDTDEAFAFASTPINANTTLYAVWMDLTDTDGDLLVDELEKQYGTDINEKDTDGDTVSDYIEVVVLGTDPLKKDGHLDTDGDGLTNAEEIDLGTNPGDADTDADMLADSEELDLGTDPCNYDTDGDGVSDGKEVELGTDPLTAQSTFQVEKTSTVEDSVTPSVEMKLSGSQVESLSVEPIADSHLFPEDMPGYMGKAYSFRVDGQFDEATIKFTFDPDSLPEGSTPAIFFFNEVTQTLEELATTIVGNVASAVVEHFSTYVLIDRTVYYDSFQWEDIWSTEGTYNGLEIVLVIDDSGSMDWNDENNQRLSVAQNLIDNLPENSKIGIVKFENDTEMLTPVLTENREEAKAYLTTNYFYSSGGTYMYDAIEDSFPLLENIDETILKMMVVLSDGDSSNLSKHSSVVAAAVAENIRVYTIGLGDSTSYFTRYLQPLAEGTGGEFYLAANADELTVIYDDISKEIDIHTDSDYDGIPDHYEDHMVAFNGKAIKLDKNKKDTDGDGLLDGDEVEVVLTYNDDKTKVYVKGKLNSYPDLVDSDNDAIDDPDDPKPMEYTITDRTLAFVEGLSYTNLAKFVGNTVGYAMDNGVKLDNISKKTAQYLKDAVIVYADDSAMGYWKDFWDSGLGIVALKFERKTEPTAVVFALRGTEPDDDLANDAATDLVLGVGWDSFQSRNAFSAYKEVATNRKYDYYITGHSLGGRLAQDVLYKTYNANEGSWLSAGANIPTPVHSATFNALGYNKLVYATLENDVLKSYKNKLTNYYYWLDLVGEGLGKSGVYKRAGVDVELLCKDIDGNYIRDKEFTNWINVRDNENHGILNFHEDYDLLYTSPHSWNYWAD